MIQTAVDAAKLGGQLAYSYIKKSKKILYKGDNSPVTIADKKTEQLIRGIIARKFPDHGIIGEEFPAVNPKSKYQWVIDPIDGTRDFIRGTQFWSTLIALLENGKPTIGVCYYPMADEMFTAQLGKGTYLNGKKTYVSKTKELKSAYLIHDSINRFDEKGKLKNLVTLCSKVDNKRSLGTFAYSLFLKGQADIYINPHGAIYDFAAPAILTQEAGGKFTDFSGKFSLTSDCALLTNGLLHQEVLKLLKNSHLD